MGADQIQTSDRGHDPRDLMFTMAGLRVDDEKSASLVTNRFAERAAASWGERAVVGLEKGRKGPLKITSLVELSREKPYIRSTRRL